MASKERRNGTRGTVEDAKFWNQKWFVSLVTFCIIVIILALISVLTGSGFEASLTDGIKFNSKDKKAVAVLTEDQKTGLLILSQITQEDIDNWRDLMAMAQLVKEDLQRRDISAIDVIRHTKDYTVMVWNKDTRAVNPIIKSMQDKDDLMLERIIKLESKK
jgi:hypothetical protein